MQEVKMALSYEASRWDSFLDIRKCSGCKEEVRDQYWERKFCPYCWNKIEEFIDK